MWILSALFIGCAVPVDGERSDAVVYGADDRQPLDPGIHPELSQALAALVPAERLVVEGDRVSIRPTTLGDELGGPLCPGERFETEPSLAECGAVLVADDAVLTAAHCVPTDAACEALRVVFGFRREGDLVAPLAASDVFRCVAREDERPELDRVRLRLERATGRAPLPLDRAAAGEEVSVAGHPAGAPALVETVAVDRREGAGFVLYADVEDGSSGSPVVRDGSLVGIVVAGETDYAWTGECFAARRLGEREGEGAWAADVQDAGGCQAAPGAPALTPLLGIALFAIRRSRWRSRPRGASGGCARRRRRRARSRRASAPCRA